MYISILKIFDVIISLTVNRERKENKCIYIAICGEILFNLIYKEK